MNIDRHNYEEYFILYMDNELSREQRQMVETFVQQHPDLREELEILRQFKLEPDTSLVYPAKDELLKANGAPLISPANAEEWMIMYVDNELTPSQRKEVEQMLAVNPSLQRELSLLQKTKFSPEQIVFTDKQSLYRHEEKVRAIPVRWWRAAAAVIIFALVLGGFLIVNNKSGGEEPTGVAVTPSDNKTIAPQPVQSTAPVRELAISDKLPATTDEVAAVPAEKKQPVNSQKEIIKISSDPSRLQPDENVIVETKNTPSNNLPLPEYREYKVIPETNTNNAIAKNETPKQPVSTDVPVTNKYPNTSDIHTASLTSNDPVDENSGKKNKLRGFFRKVTRTFEKRTNIETTDDDDRLLVAGVAIRL